MCRSSAASGSVAPRSTLTSGSGRAQSTSPRAAQHQRGMLVDAGEEVLAAQEQLFGRQQRPLRVVLQEAVALARVGPEVLQRVVDLAVQHQRGIVAEVVEDRRRLLEEQRQVVLDAGGGQAGADVLVDARAARVAFDLLAPARAEGVARGLVHRELAPRQQAHLGHRVQAALRVGVEGADRIDLVAEQVHAVGHRRAHREQVDQPAAHRVLARRHHLADVAVAGQRELRLQRGLVQPHLLLEVEGVAGHEAGRRQPRQRGGGGQQHHVEIAAAHAPQRGQALGDQVLVRREAVVGQRLPVREQRHAQIGRKERQLVDQPLCVGRRRRRRCTAAARHRGARCAWRASSNASAEPMGRGRVKRLPRAMEGNCMDGADNTKRPATTVAGRSARL